ncbi:MAG: N-acetylmuramoyl-L-alanine amidase [Solirubrobacterales bacterium]|nr:N-acetylmuramoyl-L-alanine amidase [Solirubrobacterales bacterium]
MLAAAPPIVHDPIPFPAARIEQMRAYSRRHYGRYRAKLTDPKVIVEHLTANTSYSATWSTFASNAPDPEIGEHPGTCAHFVIDQQGRIHQLVSLKWMCRHTVGLNDVSIGIEHVGTSEAQVWANRRMRRASLRLTRWLMGREHITLRNVIGHNESLRSPYHHERVARLRTQTHADFPARWMKRFRAAL